MHRHGADAVVAGEEVPSPRGEPGIHTAEHRLCQVRSRHCNTHLGSCPGILRRKFSSGYTNCRIRMSNHLPAPNDQPLEHPEALAPWDAATPMDYEAYPASGSEGGGFNWRRYVAALLRYKWLILLVALGGSALAIAAAQFVTPVYTARSTLWIENESGNVTGPIRAGGLLQSAAWAELLKTRAVLEPVARQERLYIRPTSAMAARAVQNFEIAGDVRPDNYVLRISEDGTTYELLTGLGAVVDRGAVGTPIGRELGFRWDPPTTALPAGESLQFSVLTPGDAANQLARVLTTSLDQQGNFLSITLEGENPEKLASVLNAISDQYVEVAANLKRGKLDELTTTLGEQLRSSSQDLARADLALEQFQVNTITMPSRNAAPVAGGVEITRDPVVSNYFGLRVEREQLRQDREDLANALGRSQSSGDLAIESFEVIPSVAQATELNQALDELAAKRAERRQLLARYTEQDPRVMRAQQQIGELEAEIRSLSGNLGRQLSAREREVASRIESASGELQGIPQRSIEEDRLARDREIAARQYMDLKNRYDDARLARASTIPDVRILDRAPVPLAPTNESQKMQIIFLGILASLGLGLAGALLLDRLDPRIRYPEQITGDMGLNILGVVPHASEPRSRMSTGNATQVIEAFREIRLNVANAYGTAGPVVLTISSPGVGDGKSFVTSNLALAFADQGYRTLLVDADIRRGGLHRLFGRDRKPGLTDYLAGRLSEDQVVQRTDYPTLHMIGSGTRMKEGPELLGTAAMSRLLAKMRSQYHVILFDSPPLGAGVDPFALGTLSGNLLLVLRTGNTNRDLATAKLELLDRLPIRLLGAVLNDVPSRGVYRYHSYLSGYDARDEETFEDADAPRQLQGA